MDGTTKRQGEPAEAQNVTGAGISVFDDPYRLKPMMAEAYGEDRYITIGMDKELDALYVCYTTK